MKLSELTFDFALGCFLVSGTTAMLRGNYEAAAHVYAGGFTMLLLNYIGLSYESYPREKNGGQNISK